MQTGKLVAGPLRQNFDASVVIVTDPPGNRQHVGFAFYEPAETDTLDASTDDEATGLNGFVGRSHVAGFSGGGQRTL